MATVGAGHGALLDDVLGVVVPTTEIREGGTIGSLASQGEDWILGCWLVLAPGENGLDNAQVAPPTSSDTCRLDPNSHGGMLTIVGQVFALCWKATSKLDASVVGVDARPVRHIGCQAREIIHPRARSRRGHRRSCEEPREVLSGLIIGLGCCGSSGCFSFRRRFRTLWWA